jgi:hypothetical protein
MLTLIFANTINFTNIKIEVKENNILIEQIMKTNSVRYWEDKKEKLLKKYENLTERDLNFDEGKEKEMIEILGYKLGKTKQELLNIIITL